VCIFQSTSLRRRRSSCRCSFVLCETDALFRSWKEYKTVATDAYNSFLLPVNDAIDELQKLYPDWNSELLLLPRDSRASEVDSSRSSLASLSAPDDGPRPEAPFPSHFLSLTVLTLIPLAVVANDLVPWYPMNPQAWSTRAPAATAVMREVAGEQIDLSSLHLEYISHLGSVG